MVNETIEFILGSSSKYKIQTFQKLKIPFTTISPDIDETPLNGEPAEKLVERLAIAKAKMAKQINSSKEQGAKQLFIGIDQVAVFENQIIGKSHTVENAIKQLQLFSGRAVTFLTGISVLDQDNLQHSFVEPFEVEFKTLTEKQISNYVNAEIPLDCAGSFKCEGQGILLFSNLKGRDINSLVGMPLLAFQELCLKFDVDLFDVI